MIDCNRCFNILEKFISDNERLFVPQNPSTKLIYDVAITVFKIGVYALITFVSPVGSIIVSLGCFGASQYYQWLKKGEIAELLERQTLTKEHRQKMLSTAESMSRVNRLQHEFEIVNLISLVTFKQLNIPLFLICGGISIWNWIEERKEEEFLLKSINERLGLKPKLLSTSALGHC